MNISDVTQFAKPKRKRVGRGKGSGSGKTSGRGHKGAGARSGYRAVTLAEGGGFPLFRRIPKYGFNNARFRTVYQVVNVDDLARLFENGSTASAAAMEEHGLIRDRTKRIKVLGDGDLAKKLTVEAHRFSATAVRKIEGAGGDVKWLAPKPKKKFIKRPKDWSVADAKTDTGSKQKGAKAEKKTKKDKNDKKTGQAPAKPDKPDSTEG